MVKQNAENKNIQSVKNNVFIFKTSSEWWAELITALAVFHSNRDTWRVSFPFQPLLNNSVVSYVHD